MICLDLNINIKLDSCGLFVYFSIYKKGITRFYKLKREFRYTK